VSWLDRWARARWTLLALVVLACITTAVNVPGLGGGFLFDDYPNISDNPAVQPNEVSLASLAGAAMSSPSSELKRPLSSLSFTMDYLRAGELSPSAMKATNIVIHVLNGILLYFLFALLLRHRADAAGRPMHERELAGYAGLLALAWLLLPINLTSVLYIVQRMESLANLFVLAGLIGYVKARMRMQRDGRGLFAACAWAILPAGLGVLAKETSVLLPLYALCVEACVFRFRDGAASPTVDRRLVRFYILVLGIPLLAGLAWIGPGLMDARTWATRDFTLRTRLLSEARIVLDYMGWTIAPSRTDLSFYHDDFIPSSGWFDPASTLLSALGLLALLVAAWRMRRTLPLASLGIAWFFACHTLTGTVLPLELIYEHRNYFASIGVVLAVAELLGFAEQAIRARAPSERALIAIPRVAGAGLLIWSAGLTAYTANAWSTPLSVAEELGARGPQSPRGQYELGRAYLIASHYQPGSVWVGKAEQALERAAALPDSPILAEQALVFMNGRMRVPAKPAWWTSMRHKLASRPVTVQDDSALISLAGCLEQELCVFSAHELDDTFRVSLGKPTASPRLKASYADFAASILKDDATALRMMQSASAQAPLEPAYHIRLARMQLARGDTAAARTQVDALRGLNVGGRLDAELRKLEPLLSPGTPPTRR
jgi:protein O-mannosyl-transferase